MKKRSLFYAFLPLLFLVTSAHSEETCSRVATVNYQEILVDANSTQKGEGLRFYLEKDKVAEGHLDKYQNGTKVRWHNAALGTLGTGLVITGLFTNSTGTNRESLLIGGAAMILVNFLISKTQATTNEQHLRRAIDEYNQRNLPRINFGEENAFRSDGRSMISGLSFGKTWDFQ